MLAEQPMQAGDADVVEPVDVVAHQLGRDAASSATGRSDVPAAATTIVPVPGRDVLLAQA